MRPEDENRIAAQLARVMAVVCVRNTQLETLHAGRVPVSSTGDGCDIIVVDTEGNRIPWSEVSRINDDGSIRNSVYEGCPMRVSRVIC